MSFFWKNRLLMVAFLMIWAAGCQSNSVTTLETEPKEPTPTLAPTSTPAPTQLPTKLIDSLEVEFLESFPVQVNIIVKGQLPDSCTKVDSITQAHNKTNFLLTVNTTRDAGAVCTQVLTPYEEKVNLKVLDLPAGTYTVSGEGAEPRSFVLTVDNVAPTEAPPTKTPKPTAKATAEPTVPPTETPIPAPTPLPSSLNGAVWHDLCPVGGGEGCVVINGLYSADGLRTEDEPGIAGIEVELYQGACPGGRLVKTVMTDDDGLFDFGPLRKGNYCVGSNAKSATNDAILAPGKWTAPSADGYETVEVTGTMQTLDWGWDYEFYPNDITADKCIDLVSFIGDVNIPDDTPFEPGTNFVKTWRLANAGNCIWDEKYAFKFITGDQMEAPAEIPLTRLVRTGQTIDISVPMVAPSEIGTYRGDWLLRNSKGATIAIGSVPTETVWLQIEVVEKGTLISFGGLVWHDKCDGSQYTFGVSEKLPPGCIKNENGTVRGDGVYDEGNELLLGDVEVTLGRGKCGESTLVTTTKTDKDGQYQFIGLQPDTYCAYIEPAGSANSKLLLPGNFTVPGSGLGGITIFPERITDQSSFNFGWDYEENP